MIPRPSPVSAITFHVAVCAALTGVGCECDSLPRGGGAVFRSQDVECTGGGCATTTVVTMLVPPPPAIGGAIVDNGPGLASTVSRATYESLLAATRVEIEGPLTAPAGPFAVRLRTSFGERSDALEVCAYFPPIPNLALFGEVSPTRPELRVSRVVDRRREELFDANAPLNAPDFDELDLDAEAPPGLSGAARDATLTVRGPDLPRTPGLLQASREAHVLRRVGLDDVRRVDGEIRVSLPVDVEVVSLSPGRWLHVGNGYGLEVELHEEGESVRISMLGDASRFAGAVALDAEGAILESSSSGWTLSGEGSETRALFSFGYGEPVAEVRVAIAREILELRYPFVIGRSDSRDTP